jgi:hypothetical protein
VSTDRQDQLIAEYVRNRARVEVPPDLLVPVRAGIADTPQAHRSWFAALAPAGVAVVVVAVVIGMIALIGLRPAPVGPSASASPAPSVSLGQKPSLRALLREANDRPESLTFYLGLLDGTVLHQETLTGSQLGEEAWFGPFGRAFLRLGIDGSQWTVDLLTTADPTPRRIHTDDARITALTLSPDGAWLYLSRANAASGDDLGIWRLPVAGGDLSQVLEPDTQRPAPPRTYASAFFWTPDASQLLVQHCRGDGVPGDDCTWTRISGETGEVLGEVTPSAPAGIIVGLADDRLLAGANCDGLSCTASLVDFATGAVTDVDVAGGRETLIESSAGPILLADSGIGVAEYTVTATELDSGRTWTAYQTEAPIYELVTFEGGAGAVQLDPGWFAVAMEGQLGPLHPSPPVLVNALDGTQFVMPDIVPDDEAPSPSRTPSLAGGMLTLVEDLDTGSGSIGAAATDGDRLVAGGQRCQASPIGSCATALWTTLDGTDWQYLGPLPDGPDYAVNAMATGPLGWVAFASNYSWFSTDGLTWESNDRAPFADGLADGGPTYQAEGGCCGAEVLDVISTRDGYVAVGGVECFKCRGRAAVWRSVDGHTWERAPYQEGFEHGVMSSVVALPSGRLVAVGGAAWTSDDGGRTWQAHPETFGDAGAQAVVLGPEGLVAVGDLLEEIQGVVWSSVDGTEWQRDAPDALAGVDPTAVLIHGDVLVVAGQRNVSDGLVVLGRSATGQWLPIVVMPDERGLVAQLLSYNGSVVALGSRSGGLPPPGIWQGHVP